VLFAEKNKDQAIFKFSVAEMIGKTSHLRYRIIARLSRFKRPNSDDLHVEDKYYHFVRNIIAAGYG
jgi:hypothetical protein